MVWLVPQHGTLLGILLLPSLKKGHMLAAITDYLPIFGSIIVVVIGTIGNWINNRRTTKGDVNTSKAEDLWETQRSELKASRDEVTALKNEAVAARVESKALREETFALREELLTLRVESKALREETANLRDEMVMARKDAASVRTELKKCLVEIEQYKKRTKS